MAFGIKSFFRKRALVVYAAVVLLLVGGVVVFYQVANARGARALGEAEAYLASHGEDFELADLMPEPIPDEENFFATPALLDIGREEAGYPDWAEHLERQQRLKEMDPGRERGGDPSPWKGYGSEEGVALNFDRWLAFVGKHGTLDLGSDTGEGTAAERFLVAFEAVHGEVFEELAGALSMAGAQILPEAAERIEETDLISTTEPWAQSVQALAKALRMRASASAQSGDATKAVESVMILLRLSEAAHQEVMTIGQLVAVAVDAITAASIWECINAGVLDEASLVEIRERLAAIDYPESYRKAMRFEMLWAREAIARIREDPSVVTVISHGFDPIIWRVAPGGWFDQNLAQMIRWNVDYGLLPASDGLLSCVTAGSQLRMEIEDVSEDGPGRHQAWAAYVAQSWGLFAKSFIRGAALRDRTLAACDLERYRLTHGVYPETLATLVPQIVRELPTDVCRADGASLGYRREGERYVLWSIALDGTDHGGKRGGANQRKTSSKYDGDWVWMFDGIEPPLPTPKKKRSKKRRKTPAAAP